MSLNIVNCPRCGKIFAKGINEVCPACMKEIDQEYELCYQYLRENKQATTNELHEQTGVSRKQIMKFIREGRISISDAPNLGFPCDVCGTMIREGFMCIACRKRFSEDVHRLTEAKRREEEAQKKAMRESFQIRGKDERFDGRI